MSLVLRLPLLLLLGALLADCVAAASADVEIDPRLLLTTEEIASNDGYKAETYLAKTADGYLLTLHRVRSHDGPAKRPPLLMLHGLFCASDGWVLNGPGRSPAYVFADAGYDVWLGNFRGNYYSRRHVSLSPKDRDFWMFSFQEMGEEDVPAMLDVVLATSAARRAAIVCHSAGCTALLAMLASSASRRHSRSVRVAALLAPVYIPAPSAFTAVLTPGVLKYVDEHGPYELLPRSKKFLALIGRLCNVESRLLSVCKLLFSVTTQKQPQDLNTARLSFDISHLLAGASIYTTIHFRQIIESGQFKMYDYGEDGNMKHYDQAEPPLFDLSQITVPMSIHYGKRDVAVSRKEAQRLFDALPMHIGLFEVPDEKFTHVDFLISDNAKELLYENVTNVIKNY